MNDEFSLFDDVQPEAVAQTSAPRRIAEWQIAQLRQVLDALGLESMDERRSAVASAVGRAVGSLRDLDEGEALQVLSRLGSQVQARQSRRSSWDEREDDTWIDKM